MITLKQKSIFCIARVAFGLWCGIFSAWGQDSLRHAQLPEVSIRAYGTEMFTHGSYTQNLDSLSRQRMAGQNLAEFLVNKTPAYIRTYGNGMLATVSIRGYGSERTNMVWNGISLNYPHLGLGDASVIPVGAFSQMKLQYGLSSAQYGNGAMGGSLIFAWQPTWQREVKISAAQEYGSFNSWTTTVATSYGGMKVQGHTYFNRNASTNDFAYRDLTQWGTPAVLTPNAEFTSYSLVQDLDFRLSKRISLDMHGWYNQMNRAIPPAMGTINPHARELDRNIRTMAGLNIDENWGRTRIMGAYTLDEINYYEDSRTDSSRVHTLQVVAEQDIACIPKVQLKVGGQFQYFYAQQVNYKGNRDEYRGALYLLCNYAPAKWVDFSFNLRQQWVSGYLPPPTASVGARLPVWEIRGRRGMRQSLDLRFTASTAYRVPTLNDRFWVPGGNDTLQPEFSWNAESGFAYRYSYSGWRIEIRAGGYYSRAYHWIQWLPTPGGYWAPKNMDQVELAGLEAGFSLSRRIRRWQWSIESNYAFTSAADRSGGPNHGHQLIYVPLHSVTASAEVSYRGFYLQLHGRYTGERFVRSDNTHALTPYFLLNGTLGKDFNLGRLGLSLWLRLTNMSAASYQLMENRPMPGLQYMAGIRVQIQHPIRIFKNRDI